MAVVLIRGTVVSGLGEGGRFVGLEWVTRAIRQAVGFVPYPGTLNLRLADAETLARWREVRATAGRSLTPPPDSCGGRLIPVVVDPDIPAAVIVPDVTRYGEELLEVVAVIHLRTRRGLQDGDRVTLTCEPAGDGQGARR